MRFTMSQQTATIIFSVIFLIAFGVYVNLVPVHEPVSEQSAGIIEIDAEEEETLEEPESPSTNEAPVAEEVEIENGGAGAEPADNETPSFSSFDETELESEFEDIQAGIDLLNNPLR